MTVSVKVAEPFAPPPANAPTLRVQTEPTLLAGKHIQPVPVKVVLAGTVSLRVMPLAP